MPTQYIPYDKTGYFSKLICDYLDKKDSLRSFYHRFPDAEGFEKQIEEKADFPQMQRDLLVEVLKGQYSSLDLNTYVNDNIDLLLKKNTFTITTGHQLNLFTGPLYFLYKIISVIKLTQQLKRDYPENDFVPIYWMATEDHDFEEINYFRLNGKKVRWNRADVKNNNKGAVGELFTKGLDAVHQQFCAELGSTRGAQELCELFEKSYLNHDNLADATRYLANSLFAAYGLVIIDANNKDLKKLFISYMEAELKDQISFDTVNPKAEALAVAGYGVQVNPREINLFYLTEGIRERIIEREGSYYVHGTELRFSKDEILRELRENPERFSPNVIMRPLYQEVILPNLCYIGGGGELAYWFELKDYFEAVGVPFPILLLRNSALLLKEKQFLKTQKLDLSLTDLFLNQNDLVNRKIRKISNIDIDFSKQKEHLVKQFEEMYEIAQETDKSFLGAVRAQEVKQLKGLEALEKRLLQAQKKKLGDHVKRLTFLQNEAFPDQNLQERVMNFSEFYLEYGDQLIPKLFDELDPLSHEFTVITLD